MPSESVNRQILAIAWPMILAGASGPLLGIVDTAILGHLKTGNHLSAVAVGSSGLMMLFWLLSFLRMGATGLTARSVGANNHQHNCELLWQSLALATILGFILILLQWPILKLVLWALGPDPTIYDAVLSYCQIRIHASPATLCTYAAIGWLLGLQRARQTLLVVAVTNALNIGLDFLFIIGLQMNSEGAAWATLVSEYIGLGLALLMVRRALFAIGSSIDWRRLLKLRLYRELLAVNRDLFLRTACLVFTFTFFTAQGARLGNETVAANAILMQLVLLLSYGLDGFAHAAESLTGHAIGSGNKKRFYAVCRTTTLWGAGIAAITAACYLLFQPQIVTLFTNLPAITELTYRYYPWLVALPLIATWCFSLDGMLLGAGHTNAMRNTMFAATFLCFLPAWWLSRQLGNHGLWLAFTLFMGSRSLLMGGVFYWLFRRDELTVLSDRQRLI